MISVEVISIEYCIAAGSTADSYIQVNESSELFMNSEWESELVSSEIEW